jgi:L-lactate dehydrogenase complex protein LldG
MQEKKTREKILKSIREALVNPMAPPYVSQQDYVNKIYSRNEEEYPEILFAKAIQNVNGSFVYIKDNKELQEVLSGIAPDLPAVYCHEPYLQELLKKANISYRTEREEKADELSSITTCEYLVARLGSVMMSSRQLSGRKGYAYPSVHIIIAWRDQLVYDLHDALKGIRNRYSTLPSMITLITGPSRTADIEKTLVLGAHGPEKLMVLFMDDIIPDTVKSKSQQNP